jgi:hypothetical protein
MVGRSLNFWNSIVTRDDEIVIGRFSPPGTHIFSTNKTDPR